MTLTDERRPKIKLWIHLVILTLVGAVLGVTAIKLWKFKSPLAPAGGSGAPGRGGGRGNTIALSMGAKSIIIVTYQVLTEHRKSWKRWASLKANLILNIIEVVAWGGVTGLTASPLIKSCSGTGCILGWIVVVLAGFLCFLSIFATKLSWTDWRAGSRRPKETAKELTRLHPMTRDSDVSNKWNDDSRAVTPLNSQRPLANTSSQYTNGHQSPLRQYSRPTDNYGSRPNAYKQQTNNYHPALTTHRQHTQYRQSNDNNPPPNTHRQHTNQYRQSNANNPPPYTHRQHTNQARQSNANNPPPNNQYYYLPRNMNSLGPSHYSGQERRQERHT
ncbi:hypothetical protein B0O99DRAFT_600956 [Bisporella sp. PMI_857]|nr:hypothetical protein B0O99DRAFT_600956 [Bisporella sp. PMI_857]